jgi:hypothetical protein
MKIKHVSSKADNSMKPVRATESMANTQSDAVPVGHHRTWALAFVMPPLQYKSMVTTILYYF